MHKSITFYKQNTGGSVIMDYNLIFWPEAMVKVKKKNLMDLFLTNTWF